MTNDLSRMVLRFLLGLFLFFVVALSMVTVTLVISGVLTLMALMSLGIAVTLFVYPWLHNGGLAVAERLCDLLPSLSPQLIYTLVGPTVVGSAVFLPSAFLEDVGVSTLSPSATLGAVVMLAVFVGGPYGVALAWWSTPLETPGGGPIARLLAFLRQRFPV